ncbi:Bacillopeptidase F [Orchesella cincta]|uniref:Bacillopeptidase F n=1 Tax=Orchesella cincta TaxID=48709 RepID=A0A1D2MHG0_ORCCI|nr:Bacillopeptidase F [Orchesella cincta]
MFRQLVIAALVGVALSAPSNKVDQSLAKALKTQGSANVVVIFKQDTSDVINAIHSGRFASRGQKITSLKAGLEQLASTSQKNVVSLLNSKDAKFTSFWINNQVFVKDASAQLVQSIAALSEVAEVRQEQTLYIDEPIPASSQINAEWGIEKIEADAAWTLPGGNNGQGIVVATIDTGVRATHESLRNNFRSAKGWRDPYDNSASPTDGNGHGTHTMGTIAGGGGIGVAPGAQWISCRGCGSNACTEEALVECGQFVTCPTDSDGSNADCDQAPNLVSNSWGGGQGATFYNAVINAWRAANIVPIFAQGNAGPSCATANSPGDSSSVIGVGATTAADGIASFSSLGPAVGGGVKPTSLPWTKPLLLSRDPSLSYDQVKNLLQNNADRDLQTADTCGGIPSDTFPNNVYGSGRINARKALAAAISGF